MKTGKGIADDAGARLKPIEQELARSRSDLDAGQKLSARLTEENETLRIYADRRRNGRRLFGSPPTPHPD